MNKLLRALGHDAVNSMRDLLPIAAVIGTFQLFVFKQPVAELLPLAYGGVLVIIGLTLFIYGLRTALYPIGEGLANALAVKGSVFWLVFFAFALGFGTTVVEPALTAVADEASRVAADAQAIEGSANAMQSYSTGLRLTVAVAVGLALVLGVLRILLNWSLPLLIIGGYILVVLMTTIAPEEIVGIAYDSGGVTTSTVTVPLVAALGLGLANSIRGRNSMTDGFGLIALASLAPIFCVLLFGVFVH